MQGPQKIVNKPIEHKINLIFHHACQTQMHHVRRRGKKAPQKPQNRVSVGVLEVCGLREEGDDTQEEIINRAKTQKYLAHVRPKPHFSSKMTACQDFCRVLHAVGIRRECKFDLVVARLSLWMDLRPLQLSVDLSLTF